MKIRTVRIIAFLAFLLIFAVSWILQGIWGGSLVTGHEFRFSLPIQADLAEKFGIDRDPPVDNVVLAGEFSGWNPDDETYRMNCVTNGHKIIWRLKTDLFPGLVQYKFVLHLQGGLTVWVHDRNAFFRTDDGFGGLNSQVYIADRTAVCRGMFAFSLGILLAYLLYLAFLLLVRIVFRMEISNRIRYILILIIAILFSNTMSFYYNLDAKRQVSREGYIDFVNLMHGFLTGAGANANAPSDPASVPKIQETLDRAFANFISRNERNRVNNRQVSISSMVIIDTNFHVVVSARRGDLVRAVSDKLKGLGMSNVNEFEEKYIYSEAIRNLSRRHTSDQTWSAGRMVHEPGAKDPLLRELKFRLLGYNVFVSPIVFAHRIVGYYGLGIFPDVIGGIIFDNLVFNLFWNFLMVGFLVFFFLYRPKTSSVDQKHLAAFSKRFGLTPREIEIVPMILGGLSNPAIAAKLGLSEKTVKTHVYNLFEKCRVDNRIALINLVRESD